MSKSRRRTPQDGSTAPDRPGKAVWDTRDRAEAAEARVAELEAEVRRLRALLADQDPLLATGKLVKRT
jgi:hypothetical protein